MNCKTIIAAACVSLCLTAPAAMAADSTMSDIGNAAKDAAVQSGKDKAQQKMDSMGGAGSTGSMGGMSNGTAMPSSDAMKDAAKDKAKAKASDAAGSAVDKALNKY